MNKEKQIISWKFPTKHSGMQSEFVAGRCITHITSWGKAVHLHFKCNSVRHARKHGKWYVVSRKALGESVYFILEPAPKRAKVTANTFALKGGEVVPAFYKLATSRHAKRPASVGDTSLYQYL